MTISNFPACLKFTLQYEGGWSNHKSDPGGATNYRLLGTPNYTLHGILLALSTSTTTSRHGTIAIEDSSITASVSLTCNGVHLGRLPEPRGGEIMRVFHPTTGASGKGNTCG